MKSEYLAEVKVVMIPNYAIGLLYQYFKWSVLLISHTSMFNSLCLSNYYKFKKRTINNPTRRYHESVTYYTLSRKPFFLCVIK